MMKIDYFVVCRADSEPSDILDREFGDSQFNEASEYLNELRDTYPYIPFSMLAIIDI